MSSLTEQQRRAVELIDHNMLVSAGAGSGKTHVLVERYLNILRCKPDLRVSNIIAVTYTKKAAQEMRTRLKAGMQRLMETAEIEEERQRWAMHRTEVDAARIGTIHSLCESVLKAFPAEARIDPKCEVLDDIESAEIIDECINTALLESVNDSTDALIFNYQVEEIRRLIASVIRQYPQFKDALVAVPNWNDDDALLEHVLGLLRPYQALAARRLLSNKDIPSLIAQLESTEIDRSDAKIYEVRRNVLAAFAEAFAQEPNDQTFTLLKRAAKSIDLRFGKRTPEVAACKEILGAIRDLADIHFKAIPDGAADNEQQGFNCLRQIISLSARAHELFTAAKLTQQKLDFNDLIERTYELLKQPESAARKHFNKELHAVLVDEFQDTNPMQSRLISMMCGIETRLFVIGDDKQSIYKFQGADVSVFNQWRRWLTASEGRLVEDIQIQGPRCVNTLDISFRSHPDIVSFVNSSFQNMLPAIEGAPQYHASYQPLNPFRTKDSDLPRIDLLYCNAENEEGASIQSESARLEAQALACWIIQKVADAAPVHDKHGGGNRPIKYGDFAVLVQKNDNFSVIEGALASRNIPFVTMGGSSFLSSQEVFDIENLLSFLSCPDDDQALVGVLRSPMFGIADDSIHALLMDRRLSSVWRQIKLAAEKGTDPLLSSARIKLSRLLLRARRIPLDQLLREALTATNIDVVLLAAPGGKQRSRNIWAMLNLAAENSHCSIDDFLARIRAMRELKSKQHAAPVDCGDAVKLMTIHASKGLEFAAVALPLLGQNAGSVKGKLLFHREYGLAFDTTRDGKETKPAFFEVSKLIERDMSIADKKRLFYVAMTRARDYLGLFLNPEPNNTESFDKWLKECLPADTTNTCTEMQLDKAAVLEWENDCALTNVSPKSSPQIQDGSLIEPMHDAVPNEQPIKFERLIRVTDGKREENYYPTLLGTFFHEIMQRIATTLQRPRATDLQDIILSEPFEIVDIQLAQKLVKDAGGLTETFWGSDLHVLMDKARKRLYEVPYFILDDGKLHSERPDLLMLDENGKWHIVDYKTDEVTAETQATHLKHHTEQLNKYKDHLGQISNIECDCWVYFARTGKLHAIS
jgi:ATP-dependent helicase/nuclease subunit A